MKGYLLLENGLSYDCTVSSDQKNIVGALNKTGEGVSIRCQQTGKIALISSESSDFIIDSKDKKSLLNQLSKSVKGKIVVDSLPLEYHIYDLKSNFH